MVVREDDPNASYSKNDFRRKDDSLNGGALLWEGSPRQLPYMKVHVCQMGSL